MSRRQIRDLILRHAPAHGTADVPVEGLQLNRATEPAPTVSAMYPASCAPWWGQTRVNLSGEAETYGHETATGMALKLVLLRI